jgi:hypothetical protein
MTVGAASGRLTRPPGVFSSEGHVLFAILPHRLRVSNRLGDLGRIMCYSRFLDTFQKARTRLSAPVADCGQGEEDGKTCSNSSQRETGEYVRRRRRMAGSVTRSPELDRLADCPGAVRIPFRHVKYRVGRSRVRCP